MRARFVASPLDLREAIRAMPEDLSSVSEYEAVWEVDFLQVAKDKILIGEPL